VTDDDRRFVNNPFAQALHPPRPKRSTIAWIALIFVSIIGALVMTSAFVLPLSFTYGLLVGGVRAHRWSMVAAGVIIACVYAAVLVASVRGWRSRRKRGVS
jgi:uncharacterized membrane protein YbhN (UPF0104 family)